MKLIVFTLLISCCFVFGQDANGLGEPEASRCYNGEEINGQGIINEVICDFKENSCMTKIETQNGYTKIFRGCTQTQACENNAKGNYPKCYPGENGTMICFFCCTGDLCNNSTEIPEASGSGEEEEEER